MAYACLYDVPGDEHLYEKVNAEIGGDLPAGLLAIGLQTRGRWTAPHTGVGFEGRLRPVPARACGTGGSHRPVRDGDHRPGTSTCRHGAGSGGCHHSSLRAIAKGVGLRTAEPMLSKEVRRLNARRVVTIDIASSLDGEVANAI